MLKPTVLSLFSGIGAHDLGLERAGFEIIGQCEIDPFCNAVLAKHWLYVKRWENIKDVCRGTGDDRPLIRPDWITGGFPCQQISCAGKGAGIGTEASPTAVSGLWWEMRRVIAELRPRGVLIENVPALRTRGADAVLSSLEELGYTCWPLVVGAENVGAPHRRHRVWIVGYAQGVRVREVPVRSGRSCETTTNADGAGLANAGSGRLVRQDRRESEQPRGAEAVCAMPVGYATQELPHWSGVTRDGRAESTNSSAVADASSQRLERQRIGAFSAESQEPMPPGYMRHTCPFWPVRPGQPQHCWEYPRTTPIEPRMGRATNGAAMRLVRPTRAMKLKALGNANPPQVVEAIGRAILATFGD